MSILVKRTLAEKLMAPLPPFFQRARRMNEPEFDIVKAIKTVSKNRERIPDRYWTAGMLVLASETTDLQSGTGLTSNFMLVGKKKSAQCKMTATSEGYSDAYECLTDEFAESMKVLRWTRSDLDKLKELYVLVKDDLKISDLVWCANMEVRRDTIKRMDYKEVRKHARIIDSYEEYDLLDLSYLNLDFGRFLKMVDSTSKNVYLLHVPNSRDFGSVKIPMNTCKQALAWSYEVQESTYNPEIET